MIVITHQRHIREAEAQSTAKRTQTSGIRGFQTPRRTGLVNFNVGTFNESAAH